MIEIKIGDSLFLLRRRNCDLPTARLLAADLIPVKWDAERGRYEELRGVEAEVREVAEAVLFSHYGRKEDTK